MKHDERIMDDLYKIWRAADSKASRIYEETGEDFTHPRFLDADEHSRKALFAYLRQETASLRHILLKLQIACDVEDYITDVAKSACRDIAPHAILNAVRDLERLVSR